MRFDRELLKGTTQTVLLAALAESPGHGYGLVERLRERSAGIFEVGEWTLYPLLYKLEGNGWIKGQWQTGAGQRRRRVYRITPKGRRQLTQRRVQWQELVRGTSLILGGPVHA